MSGADIIVRIPVGGLNAGFWKIDFTQVMTPEDAAVVRKYLSFIKHSDPGPFPVAIGGILLGALLGVLTHHAIGGVLMGGVLCPYAIYRATVAGLYDKKALNVARRAVEKARRKQADRRDQDGAAAIFDEFL